MEEIKSRKNPLIAHVRKLAADRAYRRQCNEFVCEGEKLLNDALRSGAKIKAVIANEIKDYALPENTRIVVVPRDIMESISTLKTPGNVVFTCELSREAADISGRRHILLENLQDPGNVGTIIRTANALGFDTVILLGDCADPYNPKTIRASMGAVFRQKILEIDYEDLFAIKEKIKKPFYASLPGDKAEDIRKTGLREGVLTIGNEGTGLSDVLIDLCEERITIPMQPGCESLNAASAAAVLMWEMRRSDI